MLSEKKYNIASIWPWVLPIPINEKWWGAIENVIWNEKVEFENRWHKVNIFNLRPIDLIKNIFKIKKYNVILLHYDFYYPLFWILWIKNVFLISHNAYFTKKDSYHIIYKVIFYFILKSNHFLALSQDIKNYLLENNFKWTVDIVPNWIEVDKFKFNKNGNNKLICLWRIEERKKQVDLIRILKDKNIKIDIIWPISDSRYDEKLLDNSINYKWVWSRQQVYNNLTDYSALILLSDWEAHPLVVSEALCSWLSVIISKEASANLDTHKKFIKIVDINQKNLAEVIKSVISENDSYRLECSKYIDENFSYKKRIDNLLVLFNNYIWK